MNFSSALNALNWNISIRRKSWPEEVFVKKTLLGDSDKATLIISGKNGQIPWVAGSEEILADDWEII